MGDLDQLLLLKEDDKPKKDSKQGDRDDKK